MEEMRVYLANLGKYAEGELVGDWFTLPLDFDEVKERIGLSGEYEEYAIHDAELPFEIEEYASMEQINHLGRIVLELPEEIQAELFLLQPYFSSIEELYTHQEDILLYANCENMEDVARYLLEDSGLLESIPGNLRMYFDYEAYGRDLEFNGTFVTTNHGIFEILS